MPKGKSLVAMYEANRKARNGAKSADGKSVTVAQTVDGVTYEVKLALWTPKGEESPMGVSITGYGKPKFLSTGAFLAVATPEARKAVEGLLA